MPLAQQSLYYSFQLKDGKELKGTLDWQANREKKGKGRQGPITLNGCYRLHWRDYCESSMVGCHEGIPSDSKEFYVAEGAKHAEFPDGAWDPLVVWVDRKFG